MEGQKSVEECIDTQDWHALLFHLRHMPPEGMLEQYIHQAATALANQETAESLMLDSKVPTAPVHHAFHRHTGNGPAIMAVLDLLKQRSDDRAILGSCVLGIAAADGDLDIVRHLVEDWGCSSTKAWNLKRSPLMRAIQQGHTSLVRYFLGKSDVAITVEVMDSAVLHGRDEILELLLNHNAANLQRNADAIVNDGVTLLHQAVLHDRLACVRVLLAHGADVNCRDLVGCTPLMLAAAFGLDSMTRTLLSWPTSQLDAVDYRSRMTALHRSADRGDRHVVNLLLAAGANPAIFDTDGATPLLLAVNSGYEDVAEDLLAWVGDPDPSGRILAMAGRRGQWRLVCMLLDHGASLAMSHYILKSPIVDPVIRCNPERMGHLREVIQSARTLRWLSKIAVRRNLVVVSPTAVGGLDLPIVLQQYLLHCDTRDFPQ